MPRNNPRQGQTSAQATANAAHLLTPTVAGVPEQYQQICTECGTPFLTGRATAKTCSRACRQRRYERRTRKGDPNEFRADAAVALEIHEKAHNAAMDDIPAIARAAVAEVVGGAAREAMTSEVLESIKSMLGMMPVLNAALEDALTAAYPLMRDGEAVLDADGYPIMIPDYDRRLKAAALVMKYTVGQPGLAPQPEAPDTAPLVVHFGSMPPVPQEIEGAAEEIMELEEGERQCDICGHRKPSDEFVGSSNRCAVCHANNETRARAAIAERTRGAGG